MRAWAWSVSLGLLLLGCGGCGDGDAPTGPDLPPADTRDGRWARDVSQLASQLEARHADLFARVPPARFASEVAFLQEDIPSLDDPGVVVRMMRLVALVGDSHTTLGWERYRGFQRLPLELAWFSDGIHVVAATKDLQDVLGARVLRIGMVSIDTALDRLRELVPHENDSWFRFNAPSLLVVPEILREQLIVPDTAAVELELALRTGGESVSLALSPGSTGERVAIASDPLPLYRQRPNDNYWFTFLQDSQLLYAQYRRASDMQSESVASFTARFLAFLDENPVLAVVLDLRNNQGGNSSLLEPLIAGLEARPQWSSGDGLYVVIGRATFSSGLLNAYSLHERTRAILVGEPTGGKPNHFGEVRDFSLTYSGLRVTYSTRFFQIIRDADPASLEPAIRVELSSRDVIEGRDPALETILTYVGP